MTLPADLLRTLPSVDVLLNTPITQEWIERFGYELVRDHLRNELANARQAIQDGTLTDVSSEALLSQVLFSLQTEEQSTLQPVINATGVILHTNLGRAVLSQAAQDAVQQIAASYSTLEFDIVTGKRGSRHIHAERLLQQVTGAEAALIVNNAASALFIVLFGLSQQKQVIISRGQLVEIGGGFRIPDILRQAGAELVEVGTTNRTRLSDYADAITDETAMILRVHSSNFQQVGFVSDVPIADLVQLCQERNLLCVDDLGSGALLDTAQFGLAHEPMVQESISAGADLVVFSGDKLLGSVQAGILVGKQLWVDRLKKHPLARALRVDKLGYAALEATLRQYRYGKAIETIPVWRMMARSQQDIADTANRWAKQLNATTIKGESAIGGGSLPGLTLPTTLLALYPSNPNQLVTRLRQLPTPIIARVWQDTLVFDPRTILPEQETEFIQQLESAVLSTDAHSPYESEPDS